MKESVPREFRTINNRFLKSITKQAWNLDATAAENGNDRFYLQNNTSSGERRDL